MEKLLRSRARGKGEKFADIAKEKGSKVEDNLSKAHDFLNSFASYIKDDKERFLKIGKLANMYSESIGKGKDKALKDVKQLAGSFNHEKQGKFHNDIFDEMKEARSGIRLFNNTFLNRKSEAGKVEDLVDDVRVYLVKVQHSASSSKIQRARYFVGQATTLARSIDEQYEEIIKKLDKINIEKLGNELRDLSANKIKMVVYEKAFDIISDKTNRKGTLAGKEFLDSLNEDNIVRYGPRPKPSSRETDSRSTDSDSDTKTHDSKQERQNRKEKKIEEHDRETFAEVPEQGKIYRKTKVPGLRRLDRDWVDEVKDYYYGTKIKSTGAYAGNGLLTWAEGSISKEQKARIESLISEVDRTSSMKAAVELWRGINVIWLKKTNTIDEDLKPDLLQRTSNVRLSGDAMNVARECLGHHVNYYTYELVGVFTNNKYLPELMIENERIRRGIALNRQLDDDEKGLTPAQIMKKNEEMIKQIIKSESENREDRLALVNFYNYYVKMNERLVRNLNKPAESRDYSGDADMWIYMYYTSMGLYRQRRIHEEDQETTSKRSKISPPPAPGPSKKEDVN